MTKTVLLYGADEFIGRLIAAKAAATWTAAGSPDLVLAGRRVPHLVLLGAELGMTVRSFDWRDTYALAAALSQADIVVNAATPFEKTSPAIAQAALNVGCSYLDVNSELDVERVLEGLGSLAATRNATVVCGGGPSAAIASLISNAAISTLYSNGVIAPGHPVGAIRVGVSCVAGISRGTASSVWRALSRDVAIGSVRKSPLHPYTPMIDFQSRPIGQLERSIDFSIGAEPPAPGICSAASLADAHAAALAALRQNREVQSIETYVASTKASRMAYPLGAGVRAMLAPAYTFDAVANATAIGFELWPDGPPAVERALEPYRFALQMEDDAQTTVVDWRFGAPNIYDLTATLAAQMALALTAGSAPGIQSPADLISAGTLANPIPSLPGASLDRIVL